MGAIVACPYERDVFRYAMSCVNRGYSSKEAIQRALGAVGKPYVRTTTPADIDERMGAWVEKYTKRNEELKENGEPPLFRCVWKFEVFISCCLNSFCLGDLAQNTQTTKSIPGV